MLNTTEIIRHNKFRHTVRSFNVNTPMDDSIVTYVNTTIDEYIETYQLDVHKIILTDRSAIQQLYANALHQDEPKDFAWKTNPQIRAPLVLSLIPKKNGKRMEMLHIGRLYAQIALHAISLGYSSGFCTCFNLRAIESYEKIAHVSVRDPDTNERVRPTFLSIGYPLDSTKPHNWSYLDHGQYIQSHVKPHDNYITVV
jgi:hypothetical protein